MKHYRVKEYFIDLVFLYHRFGIKIDKNNHTDRCEIKKKSREKMIKKTNWI